MNSSKLFSHMQRMCVCRLIKIELFFTELGEPIGKETADKLLAEADADQSGTIDIKEFKRLITELFIAHATKEKEKKNQK